MSKFRKKKRLLIRTSPISPMTLSRNPTHPSIFSPISPPFTRLHQDVDPYIPAPHYINMLTPTHYSKMLTATPPPHITSRYYLHPRPTLHQDVDPRPAPHYIKMLTPPPPPAPHYIKMLTPTPHPTLHQDVDPYTPPHITSRC